MASYRQRTTAMSTRCAVVAVALAALGLAACGSAAGGAATGSAAGSAPLTSAGEPALAPVLTYYLDQTFTALGEEPSPKADYLAGLKGCLSGGLPTTPLSPNEVAKLATERVRIWQRPGHRVVQRDTWEPVAVFSRTAGFCHFTGIKEKSIREVHVLPQTLYVVDLAKGIVSVQTQAGPPNGRFTPISVAQLKEDEAAETAKGYLKHVGDAQALGQPCAVWHGYNPDGGLGFRECAWTGGLANGISPLSILLWRKPVTTGLGDEREITTNAFLVGHLPPGSDAVFAIPAHAGSAGTTIVLGKQP